MRRYTTERMGVFTGAGEVAGEGGRGEVAAARALDEDTRSRRRRVLGEDHPHILISADNLPIDMQMLGEGEPGGCCRNCCRRPNLLWSERWHLEVPALGGVPVVSPIFLSRDDLGLGVVVPLALSGRGLLYTGRVFSAARDRRNLLVLRLNPSGGVAGEPLAFPDTDVPLPFGYRSGIGDLLL